MNSEKNFYFYFPILMIFIYFYCRYKLNYWKRQKVFQFNKTSLIFGDFKEGILFRTAPAYHLAKLYREAPDAPFIGFYIFHKPCLLLKDPKIIKQILIRDFENFSDRYFAGTPQRDSTGMVNLFGMKNPLWKYVRNKTVPTFSRKNLKQMIPLMLETSEPMMRFLRTKVWSLGVEIDVKMLTYKYAADLIGNIALGVQTDSFKNPDSDYTKFLMDYFQGLKRMVAMVSVFFMPRVVEFIGSPIYFNSKFLKNIFWHSLESRERNGGTRGDYIDSIIKLKNGEQDPVWKFKGVNLYYQSGLFSSGFETSTTTTIFVLTELAKNKIYQDRAREEIIKAITKHEWTFEAFNDMKYLDLCISEAVRLYPPVVHLDRYTRKDYKIPNTDFVLEKGTPVFMSIYGLHTDSNHFENPEAFNPERFSKVKNFPDAYIPFGGGPRMCIGVEIGRMHVKVVLSKILSEFEVYKNSEDMYDLDARSTFTASAKEISVQFKPLNFK